MKEKPKERATIFDFINGLTEKKKNWDTFSEEDKKAFGKYMINRWLSMNYDLIEFINDLQLHTYSLKDELMYKLYFNILPEQRMYFKYVKSKSVGKFDPKLIEYFVLYFSYSKREAIEYLEIYHASNKVIEIKEILQKYGVEEKIIKKLIQIK